jgi:hypothetical protein
MPTFEFICEVCGRFKKTWRKDDPPRFCSNACKIEGARGESHKTKWKITDEMHARIEKVYKTDSGNGQVAALAKALKLPRWKITRYAQGNGWVPRGKKSPPWTEEEELCLQRLARYSPGVIQRKMKERGYDRTINAIVLKLNRTSARQNIEGHSSRDVARCLGVDDHFVARAIRTGKLRATRRGTDRSERQGGDQWYILNGAIREYIVENINEIDIRKVDKHWFVDLLAGGV